MIFNRSKILAKFEPKKKYLYSVVEYAIYSPVSVQVLCRKNDVVNFDAKPKKMKLSPVNN